MICLLGLQGENWAKICALKSLISVRVSIPESLKDKFFQPVQLGAHSECSKIHILDLPKGFFEWFINRSIALCCRIRKKYSCAIVLFQRSQIDAGFLRIRQGDQPRG